MRDFGIVALLSVIATAAAPVVPSPKIENYVTKKSASEFADCYARSQGKSSAAWVYVPNERGGGAFSNLAEPGVRQPYFILISDQGAMREVILQGVTPESVEGQGVGQCI